jgi:hypothetical protein
LIVSTPWLIEYPSERAFTRKYDLKSHEKTHSRDEEFDCRYWCAKLSYSWLMLRTLQAMRTLLAHPIEIGTSARRMQMWSRDGLNRRDGSCRVAVSGWITRYAYCPRLLLVSWHNWKLPFVSESFEIRIRYLLNLTRRPYHRMRSDLPDPNLTRFYLKLSLGFYLSPTIKPRQTDLDSSVHSSESIAARWTQPWPHWKVRLLITFSNDNSSTSLSGLVEIDCVSHFIFPRKVA